MSVSDIYSIVDTLSARFNGKADVPASCSLRVPMSDYTDPSRCEQAQRHRHILQRVQSSRHAPGTGRRPDQLALPGVPLAPVDLRPEWRALQFAGLEEAAARFHQLIEQQLKQKSAP